MTAHRLLRRLSASPVARNIVWNYAAVVWLAGLSFATIPVYLRLLGKAEWGIVAVCMTLQGFLALLDAGLGQIMPRSLARAAGDRAQEARLFFAYSRVYILLALASFAIGQLVAGPMAREWLRAPEIVPARVELALRLVLVQFLFQFANNAHVGYWNGMQLQRTANVRQVAFVTTRHATALLTVQFVVPSAFGYLLPFVAISILEWTLNRRAVVAHYGHRFLAGPPVETAEVRAIVHEASGFALGILVGVLVSQLDRLVLTRTQDIAQYGIYVIVANVALAFLNLQYPLMRAFFPKIVREETLGTAGHSRASGQLMLAVVALCVIPSLVVMAYAPQLLLLWLRKPDLAEAGTLPLRLILGAVVLNAIYHVIYQRILAAGQHRVIIAINLAGLFTSITSVWICRPGIGIVLGGIIWLTSAATQLTLGASWALLRARSPRGEG